MKFYSTNNKTSRFGLQEAVVKGLAPDNGLMMPIEIPKLSQEILRNLSKMSLSDIGFEVAKLFWSNEIPEKILKDIIYDALNFEIPLKKVNDSIYSLELFHGPTCAFKDVGARVMARLLGYFTQNSDKEVIVLAATSGDTGSAVASGFYKVKGVKVVILYPSGKVSKIQEQQLTTNGENIVALEVNGTFDDCQALVKKAFLDKELNEKLLLTSANSINIARLLPQAFYYFYAMGQLAKQNNVWFAVPSGNFGNLTAGLLAKKMGLPIEKFVAATNDNRVVPDYLLNGKYITKPSVATISNAMDVGNPSNFARMLDLFGDSQVEMSKEIVGFSCNDDETRATMRLLYNKYSYLADPHGAIGFAALDKLLPLGAQGIFLETAHPAKFIDIVEDTLQQKITIPENLEAFMQKEKKSILMKADYEEFREWLTKN